MLPLILSWLTTAWAAPTLSELCVSQLKSMPGRVSEADLASLCGSVKTLEGCQSVEGTPIYHYDRPGTAANPKHIFAKALIHGDETVAGVVARAWMLRLAKIDPRNTWRVIPIANPDGWRKKTRFNAHGVDLNRNFPTQKWEAEALAYWKTKMHSDKRRYPGPSAASEPETKCLLNHLDEFKPDFLISVHTPLGLLDLDGPKVQKPKGFPLPWLALGNFPGSLGRYMWSDRKIPVLTIELKGNEDVRKLEAFDKLQDLSGTVAIQADRLSKAKH
jgi:hypothetical protein